MPKMVLSHKGGSLRVKDAFAKNFLAPGEIPLGALAFRYRLDSERFRVAPRTGRPLRATLSLRRTGCTGWDDHVRRKTARLRQSARRRGRMAARGARAAARADAAHRRAHDHCRGRSGRTSPHRSISTGPAAMGLDRRRQRADGHPLCLDNAATRKQANDLASLAPDVILANSSVAVGSLLQATRTVPIVFAIVADPVGAGFVDSLARPGGNATGFTPFEYGLSGKWLELLKQIAPGVTRVAVIRDPSTAVGLGQF